MKKYELTNETKFDQPHNKPSNTYGRKVELHRIKALINFGDIKAGDYGGWIEDERNLSHEGNAWVYGEAVVRDLAKISDNAKVKENARVIGKAVICDNAIVRGECTIRDNAKIRNNALVSDNAKVCGDATVSESAFVQGEAVIQGQAIVCGRSLISKGKLMGNVIIGEEARIIDDAIISGNAKIYGNARIHENVCIAGNAAIWKPNQYFIMGPVDGKHTMLTFFRSVDGIEVIVHRIPRIISQTGRAVSLNNFCNLYQDEIYQMAAAMAEKRINIQDKIPEMISVPQNIQSTMQKARFLHGKGIGGKTVVINSISIQEYSNLLEWCGGLPTEGNKQKPLITVYENPTLEKQTATITIHDPAMKYLKCYMPDIW